MTFHNLVGRSEPDVVRARVPRVDPDGNRRAKAHGTWSTMKKAVSSKREDEIGDTLMVRAIAVKIEKAETGVGRRTALYVAHFATSGRLR